MSQRRTVSTDNYITGRRGFPAKTQNNSPAGPKLRARQAIPQPIVIPESPAPAGRNAARSRNSPQGNTPEGVKESPNPPLTPRAAAPAAACVAGRSTGQHMLPQRLPVQPQKNPPNQKPPRLPRRRAGCRLLRRHACLTTPERVKESPNPPLTPRAAAPAAACVAGRSTGQHMLPQQALKTNGNSAPIKPMSFPSSGRVKESPNPPLTPRAAAPAAACVAGRSTGQHMPPQRLPVQPQKNPPNQKPPRLPRRRAGCRHSVAACVSDHSRACERIPLRHRSNLQRKKQHRHSGIFRVADLGSGTMPRGKYPESPAPAGSHALISRTPTPGGMLHANLGLPRPPPRNFQPPLPRFPSRLSPRRMSGTTAGEGNSFTRYPAACGLWLTLKVPIKRPSNFRFFRKFKFEHISPNFFKKNWGGGDFCGIMPSYEIKMASLPGLGDGEYKRK